MKSTARIGIGFLLGCVLSGLALFLAGTGHGTYAPMAFNSSILMFLPSLGIVLALLAAPALWGAYYGLIPTIRDQRVRIVAIFVVLLLHILPAVCLARTEPAFRSTFEMMPVYLLVYTIVALVAVVTLVALSRVMTRSSNHPVAGNLAKHHE